MSAEGIQPDIERKRVITTDFLRSYIIENENGRVVRRNTKFIKKIMDYDRLNEFEDEEDKTKTEDENDEDKKNKK